MKASNGALFESRGFGLRSIRERIIQLEGEMSIQSDPKTGTIVTLRMPPRSGLLETGGDAL